MHSIVNRTLTTEGPEGGLRAPAKSFSPTPKKRGSAALSWVALRMLTGDRAKYLGLVFAIAFSSFLIAQQSSLFCALMNRTRSVILDVTDADIWVMDPATQYIDEVYALKDSDVDRVRGIPGVRWAVPFFRGSSRAISPEGKFRQTILLGVDDASLAGAPEPRRMVLGSIENLREPDAVVIDLAGYHFFFPGQPLELGKILEMNDHRAKIVGIVEASPPFGTLPVFYTRYNEALNYVGQERKLLSFVLVKSAPGVAARELTRRIREGTGLEAETSQDFGWATILYYIHNTGIPASVGITVIVAILVGTVVAGQTFYMFTLENLKQFGALKAIGTTNGRIVRMILLQALLVGAIGYGLGMGLAAAFFAIISHKEATRGFILLWQTMAGSGIVVFFIVVLASLVSIRKVLVLEPAIVFRG